MFCVFLFRFAAARLLFRFAYVEGTSGPPSHVERVLRKPDCSAETPDFLEVLFARQASPQPSASPSTPDSGPSGERLASRETVLVFSLPDEAPPVRKTPPVTSLPGAGDEEVRLSNDPVGDDAGTATSRTDSASNSPGDCAWRLLCGGTWCCGGTQLCGGFPPLLLFFFPLPDEPPPVKKTPPVTSLPPSEEEAPPLPELLGPFRALRSWRSALANHVVGGKIKLSPCSAQDLFMGSFYTVTTTPAVPPSRSQHFLPTSPPPAVPPSRSQHFLPISSLPISTFDSPTSPPRQIFSLDKSHKALLQVDPFCGALGPRRSSASVMGGGASSGSEYKVDVTSFDSHPRKVASVLLDGVSGGRGFYVVTVVLT